MPITRSDWPEDTRFSGLHLWHGGMSNCSQRVRIVLAELDLEYEGHTLNLQAGEHAATWYQQLNPEGLVPTLVDDGVVVTNSVDIIDYLDEKYGGRRLRPESMGEAIDAALAQTDGAQIALKYCTFEFLFRHTPRMADEEFSKFERKLGNTRQRDFWREYRAGFSRERIHEMVKNAHNDFHRIEVVLTDGRQWFAGDRFSLADVAWTPNLHRFKLLRWPLELYPHLSAWFERVEKRPSFESAIVAWEPRGLLEKVGPLMDSRAAAQDGINNYGPLAAIG